VEKPKCVAAIPASTNVENFIPGISACIRLSLISTRLRPTWFGNELALDEAYRNFDDVGRQATTRRLLVLVLHIAAGFPHRLDDFIQ